VGGVGAVGVEALLNNERQIVTSMLLMEDMSAILGNRTYSKVSS